MKIISARSLVFLMDGQWQEKTNGHAVDQFVLTVF